MRASVLGLALLSLLGYGPGVTWMSRQGAASLVAYVWLFGALFLVYLAALVVVHRAGGTDPVLLGIILGGGLLFRVVVLPTPVVLSSDLYRYLWDGRVQWAGINPYRYPPAAPELAALRDPENHPRINRPTKRTVYPPGAEALYAAVFAIVPDSILGWRLLLLGCETATVILLLRLLRQMALATTAVVAYAWAPLAVFEGVQAGHVDFALLPLLLLALGWRQQGRMARAGLALGGAVALKLYPAVLLLAWWRRGDWRFPAAAAAVVVVAYLGYLPGVGWGVLGFLPEYFGSAEDFNLGLRHFLTEGIGLGGEVARGTVMLLLGAALLALLLRLARDGAEGDQDILRCGMGAVGLYLVLVPTAMHAWYVAWMLPFLALRWSAAWLWFSGAVALSYLKYAWEPAGFPLWARALEYLPLYGLLGWESVGGLARARVLGSGRTMAGGRSRRRDATPMSDRRPDGAPLQARACPRPPLPGGGIGRGAEPPSESRGA